MNLLFFDTKKSDEDFFRNTKFSITFYEKSINDVVADLSGNDFNAEMISIFTTSKLDEKILSKFKNLQAIFCRSVGYSHVDIQYCKKRGILVYNAPHYGDYTVAEYTFAILLSLIRKVADANENLKNSIVDFSKLQGVELNQKNFGLIGFGAIGSCVAKIANGFGMNILVYDPYAKNLPEYVKSVELREMLIVSDFISLNAPLTEETFHILNKNNFQFIKNSAYIVNTSRGELVETEALYDAIMNEKIKGAALDVIECENGFCADYYGKISQDSCEETCVKKNYINNKLIKLKNVLITPHIAYNTYEAVFRILDITKQNLFYFLENNFKNEVTHNIN